MAVKYDASDIGILKTDRERVQQQAHIYIPDKRIAGAVHIVREIVDNSADEVMSGGGTVDVLYDETKREVTVIDDGRGIPLEKLKDLCEILSSSGKFNKGKNSAYYFSSGVHGIGMKLANFLSDYFQITSERDGKYISRFYEDGIFVKEESGKSDNHGTKIVFRLSDKYLAELDKLTCKKIQKMLEEKTDASPGLTIKFKGIDKSGNKIKQKYEGLTILELMKKYCQPTSKIWEFNYESPSGNTRAQFAFGYDSKETEGSNLLGWTNCIYNKEGGYHIDAISDTLYEYFKKYLYNNIFSDKEKKTLQFRKEDAKLGLCGVVVLLSTNPVYLGQYKEKMISEPIREEISSFFRKELNKLPSSDLLSIGKILRDNIRARMSSQKARQQVKKIGNGLSNDKIDNYVPPRMGCKTDYTELFIVEGLSAGTHVENARYDYQAVYRLRGKVDNVYDMAMSELSKVPIVEDLSRILGILPGKTGNIIPDRILCLSDADPDGMSIQCGVMVIMACAFPQVIEEGKLYIVQPPLFAFKDNGKKIFVPTNREYLTYLQKGFSKENVLYRNGKKMDENQLFDFLLRNERYIEYLKNVASNNICSMKFTELVISNISKYGYKKSSVDDWNSLISSKFSPQVKAEWTDGRIIISGIKDGRYEMIELDDDLMSNKKTKKLISLMDANLNIIYGYDIDGKIKDSNISIYQVLNHFNGYKGKDLKRYKGLGEMDVDGLRETCLNPKHQRCVQITTDDIKKSVKMLSYWHSKKQDARDFRKKFMMDYIPDIQDIST